MSGPHCRRFRPSPHPLPLLLILPLFRSFPPVHERLEKERKRLLRRLSKLIQSQSMYMYYTAAYVYANEQLLLSFCVSARYSLFSSFNIILKQLFVSESVNIVKQSPRPRLDSPAKTGEYPRLYSIKSFCSRAIGLKTSPDQIFPIFENCARCEKDLKDNKDNSPHLGQKYARIFILGHYLFLVAHSFSRASLSENCSPLGKDNVHILLSEVIFARQMATIVYLLKTVSLDNAIREFSLA